MPAPRPSTASASRWALVGITVGALVAAGAALTTAATGGSPSVLTACVAKKQSAPFLMSTDGGKCPTGFTKVSWPTTTARGATGPRGPKGRTGATGAAGTAGAPGEVGATGATGPAGATGAAGAPGVSGSSGDVKVYSGGALVGSYVTTLVAMGEQMPVIKPTGSVMPVIFKRSATYTALTPKTLQLMYTDTQCATAPWVQRGDTVDNGYGLFAFADAAGTLYSLTGAAESSVTVQAYRSPGNGGACTVYNSPVTNFFYRAAPVGGAAPQDIPLPITTQ